MLLHGRIIIENQTEIFYYLNMLLDYYFKTETNNDDNRNLNGELHAAEYGGMESKIKSESARTTTNALLYQK